MFSKLLLPFRFFQTHFTYRQRFIFFSVFFLLSIPIPTYWMLRSQNFFLNRWLLQAESASLQLSAESLLTHLIQAQVELIKPGPSSNFFLLEEQIHSDLKKIAYYESLSYPVPKKIGPGFSNQLPKKSLITESSNFKPPFKIELLRKSSRETANYLKSLGISFDLFFVLSSPKKRLIHQTLIELPQKKILASHLFEALTQQNYPKAHFYYELFKQQFENTNSNKDYYNSDMSTDQDLIELASIESNSYFDAYDNFLNESVRLINSEIPIDQRFINTFEAYLKRNHETFLVNVALIASLAKHIYQENLIKQYLYLFVLIFTILVLLVYLITRMLTSHLFALLHHIQEMARGQFTKCFCSHSTDEFGDIGKTFDKMGLAIKDLIKELQKVSTQLKESIIQIGKTAKVQEGIIEDQEQNLSYIEEEAQFISKSSQKLVHAMDLLYHDSASLLLSEPYQKNLENMLNKMTELSKDSEVILQKLDKLSQKMKNSHVLIDFMERVSDQAALLALNSSIETSYLQEERQSFIKITSEIHRFAQQTSLSNDHIQKIIQEIIKHVSQVKNETNHCLKEIDQGAKQLIDVGKQLYFITMQGKEQAKQFENVSQVMKFQASEASHIIESIGQLRNFCQLNTHYTHLLHQTTEELDKTTEELHDVLNQFFKGYELEYKND